MISLSNSHEIFQDSSFIFNYMAKYAKISISKNPPKNPIITSCYIHDHYIPIIPPQEKLLAIEASLAEEARFRLAQEEALRAAERHLQETKALGRRAP